MKKVLALFLWFVVMPALLPALLYAGAEIGSSLTVGPDSYLANYTAGRFSLTNKLDLNLSYIYSDSDLSAKAINTYSGGLNLKLAEDLSFRGNYSITPQVAGYEADGYGFGATASFCVWPGAGSATSRAFKTIIDLDYNLVNNTYEVKTDSFTINTQTRWGNPRQVAVAAKNTSETIRQSGWTLGITEVFPAGTSLYLGYSDYEYHPDIEKEIVLYNTNTRQSNTGIFSLSPGLGGFTKYAYEARISQNIGPLWTICADYVHAEVLQFTLNQNGTPSDGTLTSLLDDFYEVSGVGADSYTLGIDYYLNDWIVLNANYSLYREAYKDNSHYYSLGITLTF